MNVPGASHREARKRSAVCANMVPGFGLAGSAQGAGAAARAAVRWVGSCRWADDVAAAVDGRACLARRRLVLSRSRVLHRFAQQGTLGTECVSARHSSSAQHAGLVGAGTPKG
jgi:hypothetical protein